MADEGSASTLVLVAAILQLLFMFGAFGLAAFFLIGNALITIVDPNDPILMFGLSMMGLVSMMAIVSLILMILWFIWRSHPSQHKVGLIITGVIGFFVGFIPGLLALIGGVITPKPEELEPLPPTPRIRQPVGTPKNYCHHCGNAITNPKAQFCDICGGRL